MKKLITVILALILILSPATSALAVDNGNISSMLAKRNGAGLTLPNFGECYPDELEFLTYDEGLNAYVFIADTADIIVEIVLEYLGMLCDEYGFTGIEYESDSSDVFVYVYLSGYNGDADIQAQYIDNCPTPCYVLFALTSNDEMAVAIVTAADGISFTDLPADMTGADEASDETPSDTADVPAEIPAEVPAEVPDEIPTEVPAEVPAETGAKAYNYAVLPDPGQFFRCARREDQPSEPHQCYLVSYLFGMDNGGFEAVEEYLALLTGGGWQLTQTNFIESDYMDVTGQIFVDYTFSYDGPYDVGSYIDWDGNWDGDVHILIGYYYDRGEIGFSFYFGDGFTLVDPGTHTTEYLDDHVYFPGGDSPINWDDDEEDVPDCNICWGSGKATCDTCWGTGQVDTTSTSSGKKTCGDCRGMGRDTCWACGGSGDLY